DQQHDHHVDDDHHHGQSAAHHQHHVDHDQLHDDDQHHVDHRDHDHDDGHHDYHQHDHHHDAVARRRLLPAGGGAARLHQDHADAPGQRLHACRRGGGGDSGPLPGVRREPQQRQRPLHDRRRRR